MAHKELEAYRKSCKTLCTGVKYSEEWDACDSKTLVHILRNPGDMFVTEEPRPLVPVHAKRQGGWINPNLLSKPVWTHDGIFGVVQCRARTWS